MKRRDDIRAVRRVVLIGSESTGKTTLAQRLAADNAVHWVPEFVREYAAVKGDALSFEDHGPIARGQLALEDEAIAAAAARGDRLLLLDTDLLSTVVYCQHYYGHCPSWIADLARSRRPDAYLLTDVDLPWVADPQRDRGDRRGEMHALFHAAVSRSGVPFAVVRGVGVARLASAHAALDALISRRAGD